MASNQTASILAADHRHVEMGPIEMHVGGSYDLSQLVTLSESVYGYSPDGSSKDYFHWLYHENPRGKAIVGNAECRGELVGHYAVVPIRIWLGGQERIAGLGVNARTKREFQGRAIFARLVAQVGEAVERQGIRTTYVVPSQQSKPWFVKKLSFTEWSPLQLWVRPLQPASVLRSMRGWGQSAGGIADILDAALRPLVKLIQARANPYCLEIKRIDGFGPEFDNLWGQAKAQFHFSIARTSDYLHWRFGTVPTREYKVWGVYSEGSLVSYAIGRVCQLRQLPELKVGVIADLYGKADAVGLSGSRLLVAQVLRWLNQENAGLCMAQLTSPSFEQALRANAFLRVAGTFAEKEKRELLIRVSDPKQGVVRGNSGLHFVGGDHDMG